MTKTYFIRKQVSIQIRNSFTVLMIRFYQTVDENRTQTDFEKNFRFDFCVHIIRFLLKACRNEISDGKSYCVTASVTVPQLFFQQPAILRNH